VVTAEKGSWRAGKLLEQLAHGDVWVDCANHLQR
jgi:hypothetical protein